MATIYRFIVEQKMTGGNGGGRKSDSSTPTTTAKRTPAKKGKNVSIFSGSHGGVEHGRKMRAINPLLNKATGGQWEKGMRVGRAGLGLVQKNSETGKFAGISGPALAILLAFMIQTLLKWQKHEQVKAEKLNAQDFKRLENGVGAINGQYKISTNIWNGRQTYNQNK